MGAGSTIAAAVAVGYHSIGIEIDAQYFCLAERIIPDLARFRADGASLTGAFWQPDLFAEAVGGRSH
jgi:hypothetical protein